MSDDLRAIGDACWTSFRFPDWQRAIGTSKVTPVANDIVYIATRGVVGNVTVVRTQEGLVVFDTGSASTARQVYQNGQWVDAAVQAATNAKLEEIILQKARDLRRNAAAQG